VLFICGPSLIGPFITYVTGFFFSLIYNNISLTAYVIIAVLLLFFFDFIFILEVINK